MPCTVLVFQDAAFCPVRTSTVSGIRIRGVATVVMLPSLADRLQTQTATPANSAQGAIIHTMQRQAAGCAPSLSSSRAPCSRDGSSARCGPAGGRTPAMNTIAAELRCRGAVEPQARGTVEHLFKQQQRERFGFRGRCRPRAVGLTVCPSSAALGSCSRTSADCSDRTGGVWAGRLRQGGAAFAASGPARSAAAHKGKRPVGGSAKGGSCPRPSARSRLRLPVFAKVGAPRCRSRQVRLQLPGWH